MIALYIACALFLLFLLLLISSVSVFVTNSDKLSVKIGFLFLRFNVYPNNERKKHLNKEKVTEKEKDNAIKRLIAEKGIVSAVGELASIGKIILEKTGKAAKHIRVKKFYFLVTAASHDPAKTAVVYGSLCAIVFPALKGFQNLLKFNDRKTKVSVLSDFNSQSSTIELDIKVKLRLWFIVRLAVGVLFEIIRRKVKSNISANNSMKK